MEKKGKFSPEVCAPVRKSCLKEHPSGMNNKEVILPEAADGTDGIRDNYRAVSVLQNMTNATNKLIIA